MNYVIKIFVSAFIITIVAEIGKRSTALAAVVASLPLSSVIALTWLYNDTGDVAKIADLSMGIFWMLLPSFIFLLSLPLLLNRGMRFSLAMLASCVLTAIGYGVYSTVMRRMGLLV